jgi:hypothetical protein
MKTFSPMSGVALLAIFALQGCSTNPSVSGGSSIDDFARALYGKRYEFERTGQILVPSMSGVLVTGQQIPKGLTVALAPAQERCVRDGGEPSFTELQAAGDARLPQRILCQRGAAPLWVLDIRYDNVTTKNVVGEASNKTYTYLGMTLRTQLLSPDQYASRQKDEQQARDKAAAVQRERQAALEQERQQRAKDQEAEARRIAAQWPARVAEFRAHLKAGDRFKWATPPSPVWGGPVVGIVVRVEGVLAYVQFENLTIGGQQTRYVARDQLEPFDGPTPGVRHEIK